MTERLIQILRSGEVRPEENLSVLVLPNDADVHDVQVDGVDRIELDFPKFSDGRAFSQALSLIHI